MLGIPVLTEISSNVNILGRMRVIRTWTATFRVSRFNFCTFEIKTSGDNWGVTESTFLQAWSSCVSMRTKIEKAFDYQHRDQQVARSNPALRPFFFLSAFLASRGRWLHKNVRRLQNRLVTLRIPSLNSFFFWVWVLSLPGGWHLRLSVSTLSIQIFTISMVFRLLESSWKKIWSCYKPVIELLLAHMMAKFDDCMPKGVCCSDILISILAHQRIELEYFVGKTDHCKRTRCHELGPLLRKQCNNVAMGV